MKELGTRGCKIISASVFSLYDLLRHWACCLSDRVFSGCISMLYSKGFWRAQKLFACAWTQSLISDKVHTTFHFYIADTVPFHTALCHHCTNGEADPQAGGKVIHPVSPTMSVTAVLGWETYSFDFKTCLLGLWSPQRGPWGAWLWEP